MTKDRAWKIVEHISKDSFEGVKNDNALIAMATIIQHQQAQITRLIDLVDQLVATQNTMPVDYEHKQ